MGADYDDYEEDFWNEPVEFGSTYKEAYGKEVDERGD